MVAIHHPDGYDGSLEGEAMERDVGALNEEMVQRADQRLHKKFRKLVNKGKPSTVAAVAVARELAGFIWAVGQAA